MDKREETKRYAVLTVCCALLLAVAFFCASRNAKLFENQTSYAYAKYLVRVDEVIRTDTTETPHSGTYSSAITDVTFREPSCSGNGKGTA